MLFGKLSDYFKPVEIEKIEVRQQLERMEGKRIPKQLDEVYFFINIVR